MQSPAGRAAPATAQLRVQCRGGIAWGRDGWRVKSTGGGNGDPYWAASRSLPVRCQLVDGTADDQAAARQAAASERLPRYDGGLRRRREADEPIRPNFLRSRSP